MDFDETRLYYSHQALQQERPENEEANDNNPNSPEDDTVNLEAVRRHFREFLRNYRLGPHRYLYRERLLRMHRRTAGENVDLPHHGCKLTVNLAHVGEYDAALLGLLLSQPADVLPPLEHAAADALRTLLYDMNKQQNTEEEEEPQEATQEEQEGEPTNNTNKNSLASVTKIQVLLQGNLAGTPLRSIQSQHMNRLLMCPGIIISTSPVRSRATQLLLRCSRCLHTASVHVTSGPFGSVSLPRRCGGPDPQQCGMAPYGIVPDESTFVDRQTLKLQESPERVPTGEMPRSVLMAVERSLVDAAPPGTRVNVLCIPTLFTQVAAKNGNGGQKSVKSIYLRVVGLQRDHAPGETATFTAREEQAFSLLSKRPDVYDILSRSVAPSLQGGYTVDIKKAITCMLFGGTRKRLPDGVRLRGDLNVLLLGDPSAGKSQFLKFASYVAPVGIYTSGKGSSAAGLTASVVKDARGEFYLEGGAMVLADGGIVAIDEFDKMRPADRVAIHEAMEQQTISIAKAGITTVLNSRSSVLAAANPVYGRYDDLKSASENIDLMTTILSRFDLIFLVRDLREEERDRMICKHVMGIHMQNSGNQGRSSTSSSLAGGATDGTGASMADETTGGGDMGGTTSAASAEAIAENITRVATTGAGELNVAAMKKYIQYCKSKCKPQLSEESGDVLASSYVRIRDDVRKRSIQNRGSNAEESDNQAVIPITVRQLEALVRISESLAKMRLDTDVQSEDVAEALRLFRVSTMAANAAESTPKEGESMAGGSASMQDLQRSENFLQSRLSIGTMVNRQRLVEEAASQGYNAMVVAKAIAVMSMRGELQEKNHGRLIKRVK